MMDNTGKLAVVTGASSGIGYELAVQFAEHGFDLLIVAEDAGIAQAEEELRALGTDVQSIQENLATFDGVENFYRAINAIGKPVAAIAINAGVGVGGRFEETNLNKELDLINLNVVSAVHLSKLIVRDMIKRGEGGRILFTSSIAAEMPGPYEAVYAASKAFIHSFALGLGYELKEKGIMVTALQPGATDTNFFHRAGMDNTKVGVQKKDDPAEVARQGYEALMESKESTIAGSLKTRLSNVANDLIPEKIKARKHANMTEPGSAAGVKHKKY
jgi:uncharacterized protein